MSDAHTPARSSQGEGRLERRRKVFQVAQVGVAPDAARCHILNLSHAGALIDCREEVTPGAEVTLAAAGFSRDAAIRWRTGTRIGIRFRLPLDERELSTAL